MKISLSENKKDLPQYLAILLIVLLSPFTSAQTTYVFRVDDYLFREDECQEEIVNLFSKHHIPLTIAFIPNFKDEKLYDTMPDSLWHVWQERINTGQVEIAQHAYTHKAVKEQHSFNLNPDMEFVGMSYEETYRRISRGKFIIDSLLLEHKVHPDALSETFVFPCNAYSAMQTKAVKQAGFKNISSSLNAAIGDDGFFYYPCTTEDFFQLERESLNNLPGTVIILFHPYTLYNQEYNNHFSITRLDSLLRRLTENKNNHFETISGLRRSEIADYNGSFLGISRVIKKVTSSYRYYLNSLSNSICSLLNGLFFVLSVGIVSILLFGLTRDRVTLKINIVLTLCTGFLFFSLAFLNITYSDLHLWVIACSLPIFIFFITKIRIIWKRKILH